MNQSRRRGVICCFMQARAQFVPAPPPPAFPWVSSWGSVGHVRRDLIHSVPVFQSPSKASNINACNKQALCRMHVVTVLKSNSSRCSRLLIVTFNIATIVCDGGNRKKSESEGERRISAFLWWQMAASVKCPLVHPRTIHYGEVDILLCQPLGAGASLGHFCPHPNEGQKANEWFRLQGWSIASSTNGDSL